MVKNIFVWLLCLLSFFYTKAQTSTTLYFDSNSSLLKPASVRTLDSLNILMRKATTYKINISAYCDSTGNETFNQTLSQQRARMVFDYFKNKEADTSFIKYNSFGAHNFVAPNNSENGKAKNRRAVISMSITMPISPDTVKQKTVVVENTSKDSSISISHMDVGEKFVLDNLIFVGGSADLLPESIPALKKLLKLMLENPTLEIELEGHVCCLNDMQLSIDRAKTVVDYLIHHGIDKKRLSYKGYSNTMPIASEDTPEGMSTNRRVEVVILKK